MAAMRSIETKGFPKVSAPPSLGKPARLEWIAIKQLVIDPEYQREVSDRGRKNIVKIAGEFDWSKFAPVIVAPAGSDQYAVVDGQHRATAAALVGLDRVPCCIIDAARAAQAAAFAAINTVVTALMLAGYFVGDALRDWNHNSLPGVFVALMLLLAVRSEARHTIASGTFERDWFKWTRKNTTNSDGRD